MKISLQKLLVKITPALTLLKRNAVFVFVLIFLGIYVYLVLHIGSLINDEPSQAAIDAKLTPVNRLKVDEEAVKKITELESQNIEIQSLFDQARQNPFTE